MFCNGLLVFSEEDDFLDSPLVADVAQKDDPSQINEVLLINIQGKFF